MHAARRDSTRRRAERLLIPFFMLLPLSPSARTKDVPIRVDGGITGSTDQNMMENLHIESPIPQSTRRRKHLGHLRTPPDQLRQQEQTGIRETSLLSWRLGLAEQNQSYSGTSRFGTEASVCVPAILAASANSRAASSLWSVLR